MHCNQCGSINLADAKFCSNRGHELASTVAPEVLEATAGGQTVKTKLFNNVEFTSRDEQSVTYDRNLFHKKNLTMSISQNRHFF